MRKTVKSWNGNPEIEPDYKSEIKSYNIIADVNSLKNSTLIEVINTIADLSEFYYLEDVSFDDEGFTIYANIKIDNPACYVGNFDKLNGSVILRISDHLPKFYNVPEDDEEKNFFFVFISDEKEMKDWELENYLEEEFEDNIFDYVIIFDETDIDYAKTKLNSFLSI